MDWKVTAARPAVRPDDAGHLQNGYDVTVEADNGFTDTVFVQTPHFTEPAVHEILTRHMTKVAMIHGLHGTVPTGGTPTS